MKKPLYDYEVDIELYGMPIFHVKAANKPEAKKKAKAQLKRIILKEIQSITAAKDGKW